MRKKATGNPLPLPTQFSESFLNRFWGRIQKTETCWNWTGQIVRKYGRLKENKRSVQAHRAAWTICFGAIPNDMRVLHKCDNPRCVNPDHLFIGTQTNNIHDAKNKNRHSHGERCPLSKLNEKTVLEIIRKTKELKNQTSVAKIFGIAPNTVWGIVNGRTWKHLPR